MNKKRVFSWALYDWANSAFATTVMAAFFPLFFAEYWNAGADQNVSTARLGAANSIASVVIVIMAPILGAIADRSTARKKFLMAFAFLGVFMTMSLYMVPEGNWLPAVVLFIAAIIGFSGGNIFYDSLLPGLAGEKDMDRVSALGYSLGYLGGGVLFAFNVYMTLHPEVFGLADATAAIKVAFVTVGIWWAVFTIPLLLSVPEPAGAGNPPQGGVVRAGFRQFRETLRSLRQLKTICLFLAAYWLYIDGVDTVFRMAVDYGQAIQMDTNDMIKALLVTQFVGFPSAIAFGYLGGKIGTKRSILIAVATYTAVVIWASFMTSKYEFYLMAVTIGLVQGGIQALSRSFFARIIPPDRSAEYFGFYNMLGKFAAVIGPILIGTVGLLARRAGYGPEVASRISITSVALLFISGGVLLCFVDEEKGKEEARFLTQTDVTILDE